MTIISYSDFSAGPLKITFSTYQQADFASYVSFYEKKILRELLTDDLAKQINDAVTLTGSLKDLVDGCTYTDDNGDLRSSLGLKEVLKRFIYYQYCADNFQTSSLNKTKNNNENATALSNAENRVVIYGRYNEGVDIWNTDILNYLYYNNTGFEDVDLTELEYAY